MNRANDVAAFACYLTGFAWGWLVDSATESMPEPAGSICFWAGGVTAISWAVLAYIVNE